MSNDKVPEKPEMITGPTGAGLKRRDLLLSGSSLVAASALSAVGLTAPAEAQQQPAAPPPAAAGQRPNIVVIMGDDVGIWNIGAYHRGMMAGRTPNLDKVAAEGMLFTDYYAEASCTAGRANFITGELPIRTGMTTVGQAGAPTGLPAQAVTSAAAPPASLGRTTLATRTSFCRRCTVSTSSSATSTTSTRWKTRRIPPIRRTC
jgi:arylsulfatase